MKIEQIYTGCLAQGAYYIESEGEAAIIDPLRETPPYLDKIQHEGTRLKYVFETHFHADFVSGHIDLADKTGATIIYGPEAVTAYEIHRASDGELFTLGAITIKALHTPGHTPESTTYLLIDENGNDHAIFTGDTLFIGDVGRPDLALASGVTKKDLAGMLFDSLRNKIMPLSDNVMVYPAHGAGSACGKHMSNKTMDTLGNQKKTNYALRADMKKLEFINEVLDGILPPPQYFAKNAKMNKKGYTSFETVLKKGNIPLSADNVEDMVKHHHALILDVRTEQQYVKAHLPKAIFIGLNGAFAPWVGTLIPSLDQPIVLIVPEGKSEEAITRLSRVGYDHTLGYLEGGIDAWIAAGKKISTLPSISSVKFETLYNSSDMHILDVRKHAEYHAGHIEKALHFPLNYLHKNIEKIDRNKGYYLYCGGGYRSVIAASLLKAKGFDNLIDIAGGYSALKKTRIPMKTQHLSVKD